MSVRESIFMCRFTSPGRSRTEWVRAWDEREAVQVFRDELAEEDVYESGTIEIVGPGRRQPLRAPFEPQPSP